MEESISMAGHLSRLLPRVCTIDAAWLSKLAPAELLSQCRQSPQLSRLLMRLFSETHGLSVPGKMDLLAHERWLLLTTTTQRQLAMRLGCLACAAFVRTTVAKPQVEQLLRVVGDEQYGALIKESVFAVEGLAKKAFDAALSGDEFKQYLIAVGVALLELTLDRDERFFSMRMRFSFPPVCWSMRPQGITTDIDRLNAVVVDITQEMETASGVQQHE